MSEKKTLYHSELVQLGVVTVTVRGAVTQSKFAGKPAYIPIEIGGVPRTYNCENQGCEEFWATSAPGDTFAIEASGSRDTARIDWIGDAAPEPEAEPVPKPKAPSRAAKAPPARPAPATRAETPPPPPARPAAPQERPAPVQRGTLQQETLEERIKRCKVMANRLANLAVVASQAALFARQQVSEQLKFEWSDAYLESVSMNLLIQLEREGGMALMPTGVAIVAAPVADTED